MLLNTSTAQNEGGLAGQSAARAHAEASLRNFQAIHQACECLQDDHSRTSHNSTNHVQTHLKIAEVETGQCRLSWDTGA